jgi:TP53 regulating kinase-like protein
MSMRILCIEHLKRLREEPIKIYLGGEAEVRIYSDFVAKKRRKKGYRIDELDAFLRKTRTKMEARIISSARRAGIPTPIVLDVDEETILMERINGEPLKNIMNRKLSRMVGEYTARLHTAGIIHGDITPMNLIYCDGKIYFVDFGLAFYDTRIEARGVDVHIYFESLKAYFDNWEDLRDAFVEGYLSGNFDKAEEVLDRAEEIEKRGRYVERRLAED